MLKDKDDFPVFVQWRLAHNKEKTFTLIAPYIPGLSNVMVTEIQFV